MEIAIDETKRRRQLQMEFNLELGIEPQTVRKAISDIMDYIEIAETEAEDTTETVASELAALGRSEAIRIISSMEDEMAEAASNMDFERAAKLRDQAVRLRAALEGTDETAILDRLRESSRKGGKFGTRKSRARSRKR